MQERIIGILGGMGPYATVEFYRNLLDLEVVKNDWEYFRIIIDSNVKIPSRTRAILYREEEPVVQTIQAINSLANHGVDFVALPCNQIHYWYDKIVSKIKIPWLNMVEQTSARLKREGFEKPLVLGGYVTTNKKIYSKYLPKAQYLNSSGNKKLENLIAEIKTTGKSSQPLDFINWCDSGDSILIACTELKESMIESKDIPIFSSSRIYAQEVLSYARFGGI